jgi:phage terminase large subunit
MIPMYQPTGAKQPAVASVIGYGGAAYGGKSYGMLQLARTAAELWQGAQIAYFRRTYSQLDGPGAAIQKSYEVFSNVATDREGGKEWTWDEGSGFYFRHCQNEKDVYDYQSQQIDILLIDEATQFTWVIIDYLLTRNRASGGVQDPGFVPFSVLCSNPGNIGHVYYSQLFDVLEKHGPHEQPKRLLNPNNKYTTSYFIPAFLEDNEIGVAQDPGYDQRLQEREPGLYKALRKGDWTIFEGQAFPSWMKEKIACAPFDVSDDEHRHWPKWRAVDYGLVHPFCCGWFTMNPATRREYIYRAILKDKLTDTEQATLIREMTPPEEHIVATYAGHDFWARRDRGKGKITDSASEYKDQGVPLTRADIDRQSGKRKIDRLLVEQLDGRPQIQVFEPFYYIFAVISTLVRAANGTEDVEKVDGDDPYDMTRYGQTNMKQPGTGDKKPAVHPAAHVKGI